MKTEKIRRGRRFVFDDKETKEMVRENLRKLGEDVPDDGVEIESDYCDETEEDGTRKFHFVVKGKPGERE